MSCSWMYSPHQSYQDTRTLVWTCTPFFCVVKSSQLGCTKLTWDLWSYSEVESTNFSWYPCYIRWSAMFVLDNLGDEVHSKSNKSTHSGLHQFHRHVHWYSHKVGESSTLHNYKRRMFHEECYALKCMRERKRDHLIHVSASYHLGYTA